jgi:hypothetical protein
MKRLQTATWDLTLAASTPTLIGTYTADADRKIWVNCIARDIAASGDTFFPYLSVTRPTYAESVIYKGDKLGTYAFSETISGIPQEYQFTSKDMNYALIKNNVPVFVHTGDVINFYLYDYNEVECEGYVEFYGTETLAELAAAVMAGGTIDANIKQVNGVTVTGNGAGTPWGPV